MDEEHRRPQYVTSSTSSPPRQQIHDHGHEDQEEPEFSRPHPWKDSAFAYTSSSHHHTAASDDWSQDAVLGSHGAETSISRDELFKAEGLREASFKQRHNHKTRLEFAGCRICGWVAADDLRGVEEGESWPRMPGGEVDYWGDGDEVSWLKRDEEYWEEWVVSVGRRRHQLAIRLALSATGRKRLQRYTRSFKQTQTEVQRLGTVEEENEEDDEKKGVEDEIDEAGEGVEESDDIEKDVRKQKKVLTEQADMVFYRPVQSHVQQVWSWWRSWWSAAGFRIVMGCAFAD
ncbi:hypothetical protein K402DRAFT_431997 [Aulographum hederae CBS 113979]|uniref:Uncharacterized protein n=1 Tax=Aulographum hederae CBS 113979 TaxID=1176131 RepID=A0A6G1GY53_9PEZI|nr:hypothetical protein K402DRAFT_431997 [Aulographum hederae CBS 113979]